MQPATEITDEQRWFALFLRNACAPRWSLKTIARSWPSMNTIEKQLRLNQFSTDEDVLMKKSMDHQTLMLKIGMRLGLNARQLMG